LLQTIPSGFDLFEVEISDTPNVIGLFVCG
jgi:hypothetical protein